jgi:hypothetical protein
MSHRCNAMRPWVKGCHRERRFAHKSWTARVNEEMLTSASITASSSGAWLYIQSPVTPKSRYTAALVTFQVVSAPMSFLQSTFVSHASPRVAWRSGAHDQFEFFKAKPIDSRKSVVGKVFRDAWWVRVINRSTDVVDI